MHEMSFQSDGDQRGLPPDSRHANRRAHRQPRTDATGAIRGSSRSPLTEMRHAIGGTERNSVETASKITVKMGSLNVGSMHKRANEVVEIMERRHIDICCLQETRWKGGSARIISGRRSRYKFFWSGSEDGTGGVGVLIHERLVVQVISVNRVDNRQIGVRILIGKVILNVRSVYAPQTGRLLEEKETFYSKLISQVSTVPEDEIQVIAGDFNGHVGEIQDGFVSCHGGRGYGSRNQDGVRLLDFCIATDLAVANTFFTKQENKLITYKSGLHESQIDFFLFRRGDLRLVKNIQVINNEECVSQHKLLTCNLSLKSNWIRPRKHPRRRKIWKLRDPDVQHEYSQAVTDSLQNSNDPHTIEATWGKLKNALLNATDLVCGWTRGGIRRPRETWWWNEDVAYAVKQKRSLWKKWRKSGTLADNVLYVDAKRAAKSAVYHAKKAAEQTKMEGLERKEGKNYIFKLAKKLKRESQDVTQSSRVRNEEGRLTCTDDECLEAWKIHYQRLLNIEFPWESDALDFDAPRPVAGPPPMIAESLVTTAIKRMKKNKAAGPSGVITEMIHAAGPEAVSVITELVNAIVQASQVPQEWLLSNTVNCFKGKGDSLDCDNYRGLKLLDHVQKLTERVLETYIREQVDIDAMQFGFMPGKSTIDAIFTVRQLHEKYISKKKEIYFAFVDLEKAFDRVPRKVVWWAMRKLGVEEWIIRVVKAMYDGSRSRVMIGSHLSVEFEVQVGLHQGSVLSPILFVMVLEALAEDFRVGCPWELLYADDLVIIADSIDSLKQRFAQWKSNLQLKGLKVNIGKTKAMISKPGGLPQVDKARYPCGVCRKGVGRNSILCTLCQHWIHRRCTNLATLREDHQFKCSRCESQEVTQDTSPSNIVIGEDELEVVQKFCYLGDVIDQAGSCFDATTARVNAAWKTFRELLPVLTSRSISLRHRGYIFRTCVRSVLLYASETWAVKTEDINRLERNENAMIRWICSAKLCERKPMAELRQALGIVELRSVLRTSRLRWFGHLERMSDSVWPKKIMLHEVPGPNIRGGQKKKWIHNVEKDLRELRLDRRTAQDRSAWRAAITGIDATCCPTLKPEEKWTLNRGVSKYFFSNSTAKEMVRFSKTLPTRTAIAPVEDDKQWTCLINVLY